MRHSYFGRHLSRTTNERRRLFMQLCRDLILHGQIKTTVAKAKAVQPHIERMVTKAKHGASADKLVLLKELSDGKAVNQLMADAQSTFRERKSGFTRIVKLGARRGDGGEEAYLSFTDDRVVAEVIKPAKKSDQKKAQTPESNPKKPVKRGSSKKKV